GRGRDSVCIAQRSETELIEYSGGQRAADRRATKARSLFCCERDHANAVAHLAQRARRLQRGDHACGTVVSAAMHNCVEVRTDEEVGSAIAENRDCVARRVDMTAGAFDSCPFAET